MTEPTEGEGVELSPQDVADLESMNAPENAAAARAIVRELAAYTHPDEPDLAAQRETWVQGAIPGAVPGSEVLLRLDSGIGLGSAKLSLVIEVDGERVAWEYIDVTTLVESWASSIMDEYNSGDRTQRDRIALAVESFKLLADAQPDEDTQPLSDEDAAAIRDEHAAEDRAVEDSRGLDS